jgi:hypothetical protein
VVATQIIALVLLIATLHRHQSQAAAASNLP